MSTWKETEGLETVHSWDYGNHHSVQEILDFFSTY